MKLTLRRAAVAVLVALSLGAVAASSALASPEWYAKKAGTFKKVTSSINVELSANKLSVTDVKRLEFLGMTCTSSTSKLEGVIESATAAKVSLFEFTQPAAECKGVTEAERKEKGLYYCETPREDRDWYLPWTLDPYTEGSEDRVKLASSVGAEYNPLFEFTCSSFVGKTSAVCGVNTTAHLSNNATAGDIEVDFESKSAKTKCTEFGTGEQAGEWKGLLTIKPTEAEKKAGVEAIKVE